MIKNLKLIISVIIVVVLFIGVCISSYFILQETDLPKYGIGGGIVVGFCFFWMLASAGIMMLNIKDNML